MILEIQIKSNDDPYDKFCDYMGFLISDLIYI